MSPNDGLPSGWTQAEIGELADIVRGVSFPKDAKRTEPQENHVACLRTTNVQANVDWSDLWFVPQKYMSRPEQCVRPFDILISTANSLELVGKVAQVRELPFRATLGAFISAIRALPGMDARFLYHQLASMDVQEEIRSLASTTTNISNVSTRKIVGLGVRVAPLREQTRIVEEIEEQFTRLDAGVAALKRVEANLRRYKAAVLKAAVEGRLTKRWRAEHPDVEPASELLKRILTERRRRWEQAELAKMRAKGKPPTDDRWKKSYIEPVAARMDKLPDFPSAWTWATLEQLTACDRPIAYGVLQPGPDVPDGIELVRVCDIKDGAILRSQLKRISPAIAARYPRTCLQGGEVLLTVVGTIGRSAVVPKELGGANTARAVSAIPVVEQISPQFVELCLRDTTKVAELTGKAHEVARKTLNLEDVRAAPIPLAPLAEQEIVVESVEDLLSLAVAADQNVAANRVRAARLRQSILKRAFGGKLVPQDPTDEPANVLLDRIRRDRFKSGNPATERQPKAGSAQVETRPTLFS